MIAIEINGEKVNLLANSFNYSPKIYERSICSFYISTNDLTKRYFKGQKVVVKENETVVFTGMVEKAREKKTLNGEMRHNIRAVSSHYAADKRLAAKVYVEEYAGDIVFDLWRSYLKEEGVDIDYDHFEALSFSGSNTNSYIDLGNYLYLSDNHPFSVTGWMFLRSFSSRDNLMARNDAARTGPYAWIFGFKNDGENLGLYNGSAWLEFPANLELNRWYFMACSYDGTNVSIYLDDSFLGSHATGFTDDINYKGRIGGHNLSADINGYKKEVSFWDIALTQQQILNIKNGSGLVGNEAGLVGYWPLNEGSGSIVNNLVDIEPTNGLEFDGVDDYVKIVENFVASPTQLTIEGFFSTDGGGDGYNCVLHKSTDTSIGASSYWMGVSLGGYLTATIGARTGAGWAAGETNITAVLNQLYHVAAVWDGSVVKVYVDGEYILQYNLTTYESIIEPTRFGASSDGANYQFSGLIMDVRVWNTARTQQQIQDNMNKKLEGNETGLIGYWPMNEGSGTTVYDESTNNNHGTIYGATWVIVETDGTGDIINAFWAAETTETDENKKGPLVEEAIFNYLPVSYCLNVLAERTGFWWFIDELRKLYFLARKTLFSSWTKATAKDMLKDSVTVENEAHKYRNQQVIVGVKDITLEQINVRRGDGVTEAFTMAFAVAREPEIKVIRGSESEPTTEAWAAVGPEEVGIRGLTQDKDWYWGVGEFVIAQDYNGIVLSSNDWIHVKYRGEYPLVIKSRAPSNIAERQEIEQIGTGIVENVKAEPEGRTREGTFQLASQLLEKYGVAARFLSFVTYKPGLKPGHILPVELLDHGIDNEDMLIENVEVSDVNGLFLRYKVKAVLGPEKKSWVNFFEQIVTRGELKLREGLIEDETIILPFDFDRDWLEMDNPNIFRQVLADGTYTAGDAVTPTFREEDRIRYLEWEFVGGGRGRKLITDASVTPSQIYTLTYLDPGDAVGSISYFHWVGGMRVLPQVGTGVIVDSKNNTIYADPGPSPWDKTSIESWQVNKWDNKVW